MHFKIDLKVCIPAKNVAMLDRMDNFEISFQGDDHQVGCRSVQHNVNETITDEQDANRIPHLRITSALPFRTNSKLYETTSKTQAVKSRSIWNLMRKYEGCTRNFLAANNKNKTTPLAQHPKAPVVTFIHTKT